jgi:hypothetical protein
LKEPDDIRTLTILKVTKKDIECSLQHVKLSEAKYQCLSYVWGSEARPFRAIIRDPETKRVVGFIRLTSNLNLAMRDLWATDGLSSKTFWIDQLSINQIGDADEKNHQIGLMGDIYTNAQRVILYGGHESSDEKLEERGLRLIQRIDERFSSGYNIMLKYGQIADMLHVSFEWPEDRLFNSLRLEEVKEDEWHWLASLCLGEWTQRLWIVQELLLNDELVMLRGQRLLRWESVAAISTLFSLDYLPREKMERYWQHTPHATDYSPWGYAGAVYIIWRHREMQKRSHNKDTRMGSFILNLQVFDTLQCRDSRDRIFSLLAISMERAFINLDYSKSSSELFHQVSVQLIQQLPSLGQVLGAVTRFDNLSDLSCPSWAFNLPRIAMDRSQISDSDAPHPRSQLSRRPEFSLDKRTLILKGRILDRVAFVTPRLHQHSNTVLPISEPGQFDLEIQLVKSICEVLLKVGLGIENAARLCRVLITSSNWENSNTGTLSVEQRAYHLWCHISLRLHYVLARARFLETDISSSLSPVYSVLETLAAMLGEAGIRCSSVDEEPSGQEIQVGNLIRELYKPIGRCLCVTEAGRLGSLSNEVKNGDVFVTFESSLTLLTLRPFFSSDSDVPVTRYQLIGDAYVEGLMNGQAYEGLDPDEVDEDIYLV